MHHIFWNIIHVLKLKEGLYLGITGAIAAKGSILTAYQGTSDFFWTHHIQDITEGPSGIQEIVTGFIPHKNLAMGS